jgi:hydroxyacylglutathione hydrolase
MPVDGQTVYPPGKTVELGVLPDRWITGGPNCMEVPDWQVHEYNRDFYILRESGCTHYEKPFLYLIFGSEKALLVDTGAGENDIARAVAQIMRKRKTSVPLVVMHSHAHGDHTAGDKQFIGRANTTFVAANVSALEAPQE